MRSHKFFAGICAGAMALCGFTAVCASAEQAADTQNYGKAGLVWMIKDYWDHRNNMELEPKDEFENNIISCTHTDVNITGNGQYEVILEGYHVVEDQIPFTEVGTLGVEFAVDTDAYPDIVFTLDECTIDGVTYTFNSQPELEESELGKVLKIKNAYGDNADTTPEMDAKPWTTVDPISVKFTVSGLDKDKIPDNPDEKIVTVYGNGSIENDPVEDEVVSSEQSAETADAAVNEGESSAEDKSSSQNETKAEVEESGSGWQIYACIAGGVVVVIIVVALLARKKKS